MAIRILQNVPEAELAYYESLMWRAGATSVTHMPEGDGEYTITAMFPDVERHDQLAARIAENTGEGSRNSA